MYRRCLKINSKISISVDKSYNLEEVEQLVYSLASSKQLSDGDKLCFGRKGLRINHIPYKVEDGKLIRVANFQKPHIYISNKRDWSNVIKTPYRVEGNVAIFTTKQSSPVQFMVDLVDIDKLAGYSWQGHECGGVKYICARLHDRANDKWTVIPLIEKLGYGSKEIQYKNGNHLDLRKENIIKKDCTKWVDAMLAATGRKRKSI